LGGGDEYRVVLSTGNGLDRNIVGAKSREQVRVLALAKFLAESKLAMGVTAP
jgi:hypothetical protein